MSTSNQRIPYPDMDNVARSRLDRIDYPKFEPLNIGKIILHLPDGVWEGHSGMFDALKESGILADPLREILIMRVGYMADCAYILNHHVSIAANLGFSPEKQEGIRTQHYAMLSEEERAVAEFTDEVVGKIKASDETVARMRELFSDALICEMIVWIYGYLGNSMFAGVSGVELDAEPITRFKWMVEE